MAAATPASAKALNQILLQQRRVTKTLDAIRALHMAAYASKHPVEKCAPELFFAVGDLLEGAAPEALDLKVIDRDAFLAELRR